MVPRSVIALVVGLVACLAAFQAKADATMCQGDEVWDTCGPCEKTCSDLSPICGAECVEGCFCPKEKPIRLPDGTCGTLEECSSNEPCQGDLEFNQCASACTATCSNPDEPCTKQCAARCACPAEKPILLDEATGTCGTLDQCGTNAPRDDITCNGDLVYAECAATGRCARTCGRPRVFCNNLSCEPGCVCPDDKPILLNPKTGKCGALNECKKSALPRRKKCRGDFRWTECSKCKATCGNPNPTCNVECIPTCQCPPHKPFILMGNKCGSVSTCDKRCKKHRKKKPCNSRSKKDGCSWGPEKKCKLRPRDA